MNQSYSDSDISLSPTQILERLQMLRQLQLMQRGKLQKQQLQYQDTTETSSCATEMISHFTNSTNSTNYNTFLSLLQSSQNTPADGFGEHSTSNMSQKVQDEDLIEGVSLLNLSQESQFIVNSPISGRSKALTISKSQIRETPECNGSISLNTDLGKVKKNHISLDEMPILSPKKDFESLILEKLQSDVNNVKPKTPKENRVVTQRKSFLRKGEGMTRFGLQKTDLVIQNTKSLPWKKKNSGLKVTTSKNTENVVVDLKSHDDIVVPPLNLNVKRKNEAHMVISSESTNNSKLSGSNESSALTVNSKLCQEYATPDCDNYSEKKITDKILQFPIGKHPILATKGHTWASILTKEQTDFLKQLKQSDYYKNYASPAKSNVSDMSCDENTMKLRQEKEFAEQNLFEILENKVSHESFNLENSFINRFLKKSQFEISGESTPLIMQKCLASNPHLMHIYPDTNNHQKNKLYNEIKSSQSDYTECCSDTCSSVSSCCSCQTVAPATPQSCTKDTRIEGNKNVRNEGHNKNDNNKTDKKCQNEVDNKTEIMKADMVEMNSKLLTTSELLKDRLQELEDEIETFRKENMNLNKMKEEIDMERHKFYEEKNAFEQKLNEEKILSEYYLAEEKEKLNKQKQTYERYVREMRGRLSKKEKEEVMNLKQEISNLKEEIRIKDAKTTSTIARLRNQLKLMEKEKAEMQNEVEKLKKENRRIKHSNDITRRLTNMKYLEQINKKLSNMNKEPQSEVGLNSDVKYKAFEIERQSRSRKAQLANSNTIRPRAKSVPNLKVTSRYAKYFSQRDSISNIDANTPVNVERLDMAYDSDDEELRVDSEINNSDDNESNINNNDSYTDNNLEKIYMETFSSTAPKINRSNTNTDSNKDYLLDHNDGISTNGFFMRKSSSNTSTRNSNSPVNMSTSPYDPRPLRLSKSPVTNISHRSSLKALTSQNEVNFSRDSNTSCRSKSPISASNHSSQRLPTIIHKDVYQDKLMTVSPEPTSSKSSLTKTNLNPTEYRKQDGSKELRFPNGNVKYISADGQYCKFVYYNGDVKENFYNEGTIKYYYAENKTYHTTHADGLEVLEFPDGQVEKRYKDGSSEVRLPNGSIRYHNPLNEHVREEWRFPDGSALTVSANGERRIVFANGQVEVHATDHKRREFPDGTVKLVYNDGTSETRYASGRVRIKNKHGNLIMDSAPG